MNEMNSRIGEKAAAGISARSIVSEALQLLLCVFLSHSLTGNPLTGGMMYLLFISARVALSVCLQSQKRRGLRLPMLVLSLLFIVYMFVAYSGAAGPLLLLAGVIMLRISISELYLAATRGRGALRIIGGIFLQLIFTGIFTLLCAGYLVNIELVVACTLFAAVSVLVQMPVFTLLSAVYPQAAPPPNEAFSYSIYTNMVLFSATASNIGAIILVAYLSFMQSRNGYQLYVSLFVFFVSIFVFYFLAERWIRARGPALRTGLYIAGALLWCFAYYMFVSAGFNAFAALWAGLMAFGVAAMKSVIDRLGDDFELIAALTDQTFSAADLRQNNVILQAISFIVASLTALVMLGAERLIVPAVPEFTLSRSFRFYMVLIPIGLMLVSVVLALRQPMDFMNRQRLLHFWETERSKRLEERLRSMLIAKYRVRFGVKIIMAALRPFFRCKVSGAENIDRTRFPSVFVCNHGFIYGPMAAVIYLPVYFRPWIDDRMIEKDLIISQIMKAFAKTKLSERLKRCISAALAFPVRWALSSFEPIIVSRSDLRRMTLTMRTTVGAMLDSDNVLIFPENPALTHNQYTHGELGEFFTGFAQIGKLYFDQTGKSALFYPVYANKKKRTLRIGSPIEYSPDAPAKEERERICAELHAAMSVLQKM